MARVTFKIDLETLHTYPGTPIPTTPKLENSALLFIGIHTLHSALAPSPNLLVTEQDWGSISYRVFKLCLKHQLILVHFILILILKEFIVNSLWHEPL